MGFYNESLKHSRYVAYYVDREKKLRERAEKQLTFDQDIFDKGKCWFHDGFQIEDAPEELKTNKNFINGYQLAKRREKINKSLEMQGALWFHSDKSLDEANEILRSNEYFIKGYTEAMNSKKRR